MLFADGVRLASAWANPSFFRLSMTAVTASANELAGFVPLIRQTGFFFKGGESLFKASFCEQAAQAVKDEAAKAERVFWQAAHGALLFTAGLCGIWSEMEWLMNGAVTALGKELFYWNNGFFFLSSLVGLKLAVEAFQESCEIQDSDERLKAQYQAVMNIVANLCFITGSLLFLTGNALFVAIIVCALGSSLSIFPILLDFYSVN